MKRRTFISGTAAAAGAAAIMHAPAVIAQQKYRWRMPTTWTPALNVMLGSAQRLAKIVAELSGGRLTIEVFPAGQIVSPLGVFDGVDETFVSLDPEVTHQTVGGRLHGFDELPGFLATPRFPYLVLEPDGLPDGIRDQVLAAGYQPIFANGHGEVFRLP